MPAHTRPAFHWIFVAITVLFAAVAVAAPDLEAQAKKIEGKLMTPCCKANTIAEHFSPAATEARKEIRQLLAAGRSEQEVLDDFVARYGDQILAAPAPKGFNLVAYGAPFLLLIAGCGALLLLVRKWARRAAAEPDASEPMPIDPKYAERLDRELREFDSTV